MNEVMKVLTVIATLFIPLSFIAGVYGMNVDTDSPWNLPELGWTYGYPFALGLMVACAGAMLVYFWRKGWFADSSRTGLDASLREHRHDKTADDHPCSRVEPAVCKSRETGGLDPASQ